MYVLASHGDYARETLKSCEMITGHLDNFATISFKDPMGVNDVIAKYQKLYEQNNHTQVEFNILVDIPNGTPANAATLFADQHPNVQLYAGLSLMLVLSIATGTNISEAVSQAQEMTGNVLNQKETNRVVETKVSTIIDPNDNPLVNVRVDARLIHGQVATMWTRKLDATRIMIVDDQIVKSEVQKATLKTAVPRGVHLSILTTAGAAKRFTEGQYRGQRVFLIVRNPIVLQELLENGVHFDDINVGNMSMSVGAQQVAKSVAVTDNDIKTFNYISNQGVKLYHQMVPNDKQEDFMALLKERK